MDIAADAAAIGRRIFTSGRRRREYKEAHDTFTQSLQLAIGSAAAHCYDMGRLEGSIATLEEHDGTLQLPGQLDAEAVPTDIQPALPGLKVAVILNYHKVKSPELAIPSVNGLKYIKVRIESTSPSQA